MLILHKKIPLLSAGAFLLASGALAGWISLGQGIAQFDRPGFERVILQTRNQGRLFTGVVYEKYNSGRLHRLALFLQGRQVGKEYQWHANGNRWFEQSYRSGLPHGPAQRWYPDGKVQSYVPYIEGEKHGESWAWHPNGQVAQFDLHVHGREITHKSWTFDGKPFYNYVYQDGKKVGVLGGEFCKRILPQ